MLTNPSTGCYEPTRAEREAAKRETRDSIPSPWGPSRRVLLPGQQPQSGEVYVETVEVSLPHRKETHDAAEETLGK